MRIKILMVRDVDADKLPEADILKERGFLLYTTEVTVLNEMIREIKPDLIFINLQRAGLTGNKIYNQVLESKEFVGIPVMYTLSEDDVYLVNRKRTTSIRHRNIIADNIIDGIKAALSTDATGLRKQLTISRHFQYPNYAGRA